MTRVRLPGRGAVGTAIVVAWLASLGWLAARRVSEARTQPLEARGSRLAPGASFYVVRLGSEQFGTAGITLDTTPVGFRLAGTLSLDVPSDSGSARHVYREEALLTRSLRLQRLIGSMSEAGTGRTRELSASDSARALRLTEGTRNETLEEFRSASGATIPGAIPFRLAASGRLRPGGVLSTIVAGTLDRTLSETEARTTRDSVFIVADSADFDARSGSWIPVPTDSARAWRVERRERGLPMIEWIDGRGRVLSREHAFGVTLTLAPFEVGYTNYQTLRRQRPRLGGSTLPGATRLAPGRRRPDSLTEEVRVAVARADGPAWPGAVQAFAGGRQVVIGDTVVIRAEPPRPDPTPPPRTRNSLLSPGELGALRGALREALAQEPLDPDTLGQLSRWVAHAVQYLDTPEAPSGKMTVLRSRRGGAEGKADLLTALAELAGMPARRVVGVDVSDPALPAHVWVEVWRDGWTAVDPVSGQVPASAYLLRITEGSSPWPLGMVPLIGGLRATLVSPRRPGRAP
jgi:hypothetical protein